METKTTINIDNVALYPTGDDEDTKNEHILNCTKGCFSATRVIVMAKRVLQRGANIEIMGSYPDHNCDCGSCFSVQTAQNQTFKF